MSAYLWIALGSALGGMARYGCSTLTARILGEHFPWGTLIVNVFGSFGIGLFAAASKAGDAQRLFVMVGLFGGFTTFSAFSLQTLVLVQKGELAKAAANVVFSVVLCLIAVWLGHAAGSAR